MPPAYHQCPHCEKLFRPVLSRRARAFWTLAGLVVGAGAALGLLRAGVLVPAGAIPEVAAPWAWPGAGGAFFGLLGYRLGLRVDARKPCPHCGSPLRLF